MFAQCSPIRSANQMAFKMMDGETMPGITVYGLAVTKQYQKARFLKGVDGPSRIWELLIAFALDLPVGHSYQ